MNRLLMIARIAAGRSAMRVVAALRAAQQIYVTLIQAEEA